jgi:hypothetical protein
MDKSKTTSFRAIVVLQCIIALWVLRMLLLVVATGNMDIDHAESLVHAIWIATATGGIPLFLSVMCVLGLYRGKRYGVPMSIGFDSILTVLLGFALANDLRLLGQSLPATGYHAAHVDLAEHLFVLGCSLGVLSLLIRHSASSRVSVPRQNGGWPRSR